jgi:pimeloyl-ACP methyl ester carboxylesterase
LQQGLEDEVSVKKRLLRNGLTLFALHLLVTLTFLCHFSEAADGTVVTVDGIAGLESFADYVPPVPTQYLFDKIDANWRTSLEEKIGPIHPFPWNNSANATSWAVENLYNLLKQISDNNKITYAPLVIVSHSWGTVLTYIVLHEYPDILVDKLITMGSPLESIQQGVNPITKHWLEYYGIYDVHTLPNIRIWNNYWSWCDLFSSYISAASTNYVIQACSILVYINEYSRLQT